MSEIICYMPTYAPANESEPLIRTYTRASDNEIASRIADKTGNRRPTVYMDAIDSILNTRSDVFLAVGDGRSTDSIRTDLSRHHEESGGAYRLDLYPDKMSQWIIFNDILNKYATEDTKYFIYSSSDVIWQMDWVSEAIKEFERNPKVRILFPCVNSGDPNLPCQIAVGPRNLEAFSPPYQDAAKAQVLNAYVMIFRMDFLRTYGGYPTLFRNCFTESFLAYMCEAMGGEMQVLPRGWCHHYGSVDIWANDDKSYYYYNEEKFVFQGVMNQVLMYKAMELMTVQYLKKALYKRE